MNKQYEKICMSENENETIYCSNVNANALSSTPGKIHDVQASCLHGWGWAVGPILAPVCIISIATIISPKNCLSPNKKHKPLDQLLDQRHFLRKDQLL